MKIFLKKVQQHLEMSSFVATRFMLAFLVLIFGAVIALNINVQTASAGPGQPFGGMITYVLYCGCTYNFAITFNDLTISPPVTLPLIYQYGVTFTYPSGPPQTIGQWMLGTWTGGGSCQIVIPGPPYCELVPTAGTMFMVGTSRT